MTSEAVTPEARIRARRLKLLLVLGLGTLPGLIAPSKAQAVNRSVECIELEEGESCPDLNVAADAFEVANDETSDPCMIEFEVLGHAPSEPGSCCYAVSTTEVCPSGYWDYDEGPYPCSIAL